MRTLLLDSTFFPVKVISWQRAMILLVTGRAEVVDEYEGVQIRSVNHSFSLPRVLKLFVRHKSNFQVRFSRQNVFWRDQFTCQYCAQELSGGRLTLDHVIPRSKGGATSWQNVVTACQKCNAKKADQLPQEAGMSLLKKPVAPKWSPFLCLRLKQSDPNEWGQWMPNRKWSSAVSS